MKNNVSPLYLLLPFFSLYFRNDLISILLHVFGTSVSVYLGRFRADGLLRPNHLSCDVQIRAKNKKQKIRATRDCNSVYCDPSYTDRDVAVVCVATQDEGDGDTGGLSSRTVIALIVSELLVCS